MTALAAKKYFDHQENKLCTLPVVASDVIYAGALVKANAAGYAEPCAAEAGAVFVGIATETIDNSAGAAGDLSVEILRGVDVTFTGQTGFEQADIGSKVYASDDQTISVTQASNEQEVGTVVEYISATSVRVQLKNLAY